MEVKIKKLSSWQEVLNAARFTRRLEPLAKEPSAKFKKQIIRAEHSPLRLLEFEVYMYDIPYYVMGHLVRHIHAQPFVSTSRPDITGSPIPRNKMVQTLPVNMQLHINAQEFINISKVRLCNKAEKTTKALWNMIIDALHDIEPELAEACVPSCIYRGFCPEIKSCGFWISKSFESDRKKYLTELLKLD